MSSEAAIVMDSGESAAAIPDFSTMVKAHDIFISYRRDGGEHLAGRVKDALERRGFSAFLDVEDLKSGKFNEALLRKIEDATDFIVILTPGCLERCKNEGDWLRREIRHAIEKKRNVVPVLARGFEMPIAAALPNDIADLPEYNGITPAHELFEASIDRLASKYLKARKNATPQHPAASPPLDLTLTPRTLARLAELVRTGTPEEVDQLVRGLKLTISPVAKRAASRFIDWLGRYNHPGYATIGEPLYSWLTADSGADQVAEDWTLFLRMVGCVLISTELKTGVRIGRIDNDEVELLGLPDSEDWVPFIEKDLFAEAVAENRIRKQTR